MKCYQFIETGELAYVEVRNTGGYNQVIHVSLYRYYSKYKNKLLRWNRYKYPLLTCKFSQLRPWMTATQIISIYDHTIDWTYE